MKDESLPSDGASPPPDRRATRAAVWATVGIVVILALAAFIAVFLGPVLHVRSVVADDGVTGWIGGTIEVPDTLENFPWAGKALDRLGGPTRACPRLTRYVRLPLWLAPKRENAVFLLGFCGPEAVPALVKALDDPNDFVAWFAADGLRRAGSTPAEAVPVLRRMLNFRIHYLSHPGWQAVLPIIEALGNAGPAAREAIPDLEAILKDKTIMAADDMRDIPETVRKALKKIRGGE